MWKDLLEDYPELIMVQEWMKKGNISDHPWYAHCHAIQRRTKHMNKALTKVLKAEDKEFLTQVTRIDQMRDLFKKPKEDPKDSWREQPRAVVDNTYVHRPMRVPEQLPPFWAMKKK